MVGTVLVTGATGFVGAAVVRALLRHGHAVRALVRPPGGGGGSPRGNLAGLSVETREGCLEDPASLAAAVAGCTALVHAAADYRLWVPAPEAMYRANVEGTAALMRAALQAGVTRIVHTSSVATLGMLPGGAPADELTPSHLEEMIGPYKRSKYLAEQEVRRMVDEEGLPAVIVNPSTPVGPGDARPTPTGRMIVEAASGRMPAFVDTGLNIVHVDDVAEGHVLALEHGQVGERYVLGGDNLTLAAILAEIARLCRLPPPTIKLPHLAVWPVAMAAEQWGRLTGREPFVTRDALRMSMHRMWFSSAKAEKRLGYRHRPAVEGLVDAVAWFRQAKMCP